jgi:hypothetical protein
MHPKPVRRTVKIRPIVGGISIGVPEEAFDGKMAGTLGLVVQGSNDFYYILSNAHVIATNRKAQFLPLGTAVFQPGTYEKYNTILSVKWLGKNNVSESELIDYLFKIMIKLKIRLKALPVFDATYMVQELRE